MKLTPEDDLRFGAEPEAGRRRSSIKRMMILIAVVAAGFAFLRAASEVLRNLGDDRIYQAERTTNHRWEAGPSPQIDLEVFFGSIFVIPSVDGSVSAKIYAFTTTEHSQEAADIGLKDIRIVTSLTGDRIRIKTDEMSPKSSIRSETRVELRVPADASLNILVAHGYVHLGSYLEDMAGGLQPSLPVALKSAKVRDLGEHFHGIIADIAPRPSMPPTRLDLGSRLGAIDIRGDNLQVEARTESEAIDFEGQLAAGVHRFESGRHQSHSETNRLVHRGIKITLPPGSNIEAEATSGSGPVDFGFPREMSSTDRPNRFRTGSNAGPKVELQVRSEDGPVRIWPSEVDAPKP